MEEYRPHSFDTRGFIFGFSFIAITIALFGAARYGSLLAAERFMKEPQAAAVATTESSLAELRAQRTAEASDTPLRVVIGPKAPPQVSAKTFIVGDVKTGTIFAQKNVAAPYPIASITKLFTALAASNLMAGTTTIAVTEADRRRTEGTPGSIQRDESFAMQDVFYPLLVESNNSVAFALARTAGEEMFMDEVRAIAESAGMSASTFEEPSGLSENNATNAVDIFLLTRHIYKEAPNLLEISRTSGKVITAASGRTYTFPNFNSFYQNENFVGGKTGYTSAARQTMTTVFDIPVEETSATIAIIVLGSENRQADITALLSWFTKNATATTTPALY